MQTKNTRYKYIRFSIIAILILSTIGAINCLSPYETHVWRGARAYGDSNFVEAIAEFTKAIEICPDVAQNYSWRGGAYQQIAHYDLAIDDYTMAINLEDPEFSGSEYASRGFCYYAKGVYELAIQDLTEAITKDHHPYYYNYRGLAYHSEKKYDLAIEDFNIAIEAINFNAELYSNRADTYIATGQTALAKVDLLKAIELSEEPALTQSAEERLDILIERE